MATRTILIVDDESVLVEALAYNLEQAGYQVLTASNGTSALEIIQQEQIDLVLLDILLPGIDGLEVCRRLRQNQSTAKLPVILLTAKDDEIDKVVGLEVGADDYVTKPFGKHELLSRVRALFRRVEYTPAQTQSERTTAISTVSSSASLALNDIRIDLAGRRVSCRGHEVELQPRLFDLLVYFIKNRGTVLTRSQLLHQVWGYAYTGDTRTVDVHVRWLRERLEEDPANPRFIHTVRGVGYVVR